MKFRATMLKTKRVILEGSYEGEASPELEAVIRAGNLPLLWLAPMRHDLRYQGGDSPAGRELNARGISVLPIDPACLGRIVAGFFPPLRDFFLSFRGFRHRAVDPSQMLAKVNLVHFVTPTGVDGGPFRTSTKIALTVTAIAPTGMAKLRGFYHHSCLRRSLSSVMSRTPLKLDMFW